ADHGADHRQAEPYIESGKAARGGDRDRPSDDGPKRPENGAQNFRSERSSDIVRAETMPGAKPVRVTSTDPRQRMTNLVSANWYLPSDHLAPGPFYELRHHALAQVESRLDRVSEAWRSMVRLGRA